MSARVKVDEAMLYGVGLAVGYYFGSRHGGPMGWMNAAVLAVPGFLAVLVTAFAFAWLARRRGRAT